MYRSILALPFCALPFAVLAEDSAEDAFVAANVLGIFYHELGHAVIDIEDVPIFGQEEDAADVFSIYLIHALHDEDTAQDLAFDAALGFWAEAEDGMFEDDSIPWWDEHGPDAQRFYNTVCVFYGGDPEARRDFADAMDLPEERADSCPEEFDMADASWGSVLDDLMDRGASDSIQMTTEGDSLAEQLIAQEVEYLNGVMGFETTVDVSVESCGEANAFYDPGATAIIFCTEFEDHLRQLAEDQL